MRLMDDTNVDKLLAEARRGRRESLGSLFELYRNYLYLLARTQVDLHLQKGASPSDLVQESFLDAFRDFDRFRGSTPPELRAWLRRILLNNILRLVERQVKAQKRDVRREVSLQARIDALDRSSAAFDIALASTWSSPSVAACTSAEPPGSSPKARRMRAAQDAASPRSLPKAMPWERAPS